MNIPKEGDRVYVPPRTTPSYEYVGYAGTVKYVSEVSHGGRFLVYLTDCTGPAKDQPTWLHHISGYN